MKVYENMQIDDSITKELTDTLAKIKTFPADVPLIYHATGADFEEFLTSKTSDENSNSERGIYFSGSKEGTMEYIMDRDKDAYLFTVSTEGLNLADGDNDIHTSRWLEDIYLHHNPDGIDEWEENEDEYFDMPLMIPIWSKIPKWLPDTLERAMIRHGIDGCMYKDFYDLEDYFPKVYCIWNLKKLKILSKEKFEPSK
jgi:hypothetical protein